MRGLFLTCRWLPSHCILTQQGERQRQRQREEEGRGEEWKGEGGKVCSLVSLLTRTLILSDQGPTLMISFNLNYLLRGPISKYSHTLGYGFIK